MPVLPPLDGTLYLPQILDFHLKHNPHSTVYVFAYDDGQRISITFDKFVRAVHRGARVLDSVRRGSDRPVVGIIANADILLYQTVALASIMCGITPFLISPRNSPAAIDDMLEKMDCTDVLIVTTNSLDLVLAEALTVPDLHVHGMPTLEQLYEPDRIALCPDFIPYSAPDVKLTDIALIIHSSGSTGFPKPVPQSFATVLHWMNFLDVSGIRDPSINVCAAMAIPGFHAFGVNFQLLYPLTLVKPAALFPPASYDFRTGECFPNAMPMFPQPTNVLQHIQWTGADMLLSVPSLLASWRVNPAHIEVLKTMRCVCCSSGPLPQDVGDDLVRQGVPLCTSYGATEFGIPTYRLPLGPDGYPSIEVFRDIEQRLKDWRYVSFNKHVTLRLIPQTGSTDVFELQILTTPSHQPAIENLPDVAGYATHDIVKAHPTSPGLWRVIGRTDEVIVLSAGEKVVPNQTEDKVNSSPDVSGALMFGRGRPHCGLIVEPRDPERWAKKGVHFIYAIWPFVEEANSQAPAFSRILRNMVIVTSREKPMERVGKGSLARQATLSSFEKEIEDAYQNFQTSTKTEPPVSWARDHVIDWLKRQTVDLVAKRNSELNADDDLFSAGFDSISAVSLLSRISGALPGGVAHRLTPTFVYEHPTLSDMANALLNVIAGNAEIADNSSKLAELTAMIQKYSVFESPISGKTQRSSSLRSVLLTGTTGALGSYLLEGLLRHPEVVTVFAVNRPSDTPTYQRQADAFRSKGLDAQLLDSRKLVWIDGDPLESDNLPKWKDNVDVVIHNAWRLDFNLSLSSFEPLIRSTHDMLEVCRASTRNVQFFFTSSTSAAQNWDSGLGAVPERAVESRYALGKGYGESKHVVEVMMEKAGIDATVLRIGQVAGGAPMGAWATTDWVPAMVKSSVTLGVLPSAVGTVSWIPMHSLANSIIDIVFSDPAGALINLLHPNPTSWDSVIGAIGEQLHAQHVTPEKLLSIPFSEWMQLVEECDEDPASVPAIKLRGFFRHFADKDAQARSDRRVLEAGGRAHFELRNGYEMSSTLRGLKDAGVILDDVASWIRCWKEWGFL
ncbi:acetyl-CoA synthetase-like protein [Hymenopellis radicata]|nr:acetyl-CoA synthetase-like protein [Hymenopellis radicata]